ncbi:MAG: deoxynucleotide monophosphate kinase family protein [Methylobacter sp.]
MSKTIIGFTGRKQSGKTTAAQYLVDKGFLKCSFAEPIKDMTWFFLQGFGLSATYVNQLLTTHKEVVIPELGVSARHVMQTLGTDWGRKLIHNDIWVMSMSKRLAEEPGDLIVFDDVRFENEAAMIRGMGGLIIHIDRGDQVADSHASEQGIEFKKRDVLINNDYALEDFLANVDDAVDCVSL